MLSGICESLGKDAEETLLCIFFINKRLLSTNNAARYTAGTSCNWNDRRRNGAVCTLYFSYAAGGCRIGQCYSEFVRISEKMQRKRFSASFYLGCTVHRWHIVQLGHGLHPLFSIRCRRLSHWAMLSGICENLGKDAGGMLLCIFFINKRTYRTKTNYVFFYLTVPLFRAILILSMIERTEFS